MEKSVSKAKLLILVAVAVIMTVVALCHIGFMHKQESSIIVNEIQKKNYEEIYVPTPNYDRDKENNVIGIVLHHTAEPTVENSLSILSSSEKKVGAHVVIDTDGTRYVMADPEVAVYHAGFSIIDGKEGCNYCTVGVEFQGNTLVSPLTENQILSGVEYLLPIIKKYHISLDHVVTHEMVRTAYKKKYPQKKCSVKVDITKEEYSRFMRVLTSFYEEIEKK